MGNGIAGDAVTTEMGGDIRLEKGDQGQIKVPFDLLFREGYAICGEISLRMEVERIEQQTEARPSVVGCTIPQG
jgi:hypothetical protein